MGKTISDVMNLITEMKFKNFRGLDIYEGLINPFESSAILDFLFSEYNDKGVYEEIKKYIGIDDT